MRTTVAWANKKQIRDEKELLDTEMVLKSIYESDDGS